MGAGPDQARVRQAGDPPPLTVGAPLVRQLLFGAVVMTLPDEDRGVPDPVVEFVHECIDRLETLHVLLLLHASAPRSWSIHDVSTQRQSSAYSAEISLRQLTRAGLLDRQDSLFRFQPRTPELAQIAAWLVWWYQTRPNALITLIFSGRRRS